MIPELLSGKGLSKIAALVPCAGECGRKIGVTEREQERVARFVCSACHPIKKKVR